VAELRPRRQRWWWWALMALICVVAIVPAASTTPTEGQSQERLFALASALKCQTCIGESVADSQSPSAVQFREEIQAQMAQGRTDDEILNFFVERYEREILLTPPGSGVGALVWIVPVVVVAGALVVLVGAYRRRDVERADREATPDDDDRVSAALRERRQE
jgi:cytochrome c-type biogenesis protein CcmH/NrfF